MCGICGFTKFNKTVEDADNILKAMSDTLISRGLMKKDFI